MALVLLKKLPNRVAILSFNCPKQLNALTFPVGEAFSAAFASLDSSTSCVVLTGEGDSFSAGGSLEFLRARAHAPAAENVSTMLNFYSAFLRPLRSCKVPVIAAVQGNCVGAGAALASACDMRVVSASARVGWTFTSGVAIHPGMGSTHYLPALVGQQNAARLLLGGDLLPGRELFRMGWAVEEAEDDARTLPRAIKLAERIAANAPRAVAETVRTLRDLGDEGLALALQREAEAQAVCYAGPDFLVGVEAVANKTKPVWGQFSLPDAV